MNTLVFKTPDEESIKKCAEIIRCGGLVAFPTETVYGLGADATNSESALKIFKAKGRPSDNPLIVHLASPKDADKYAVTAPLFYKLAELFMPGPLTVIMPKKNVIPASVTGGLDTVGLRVPSSPIAHKLIEYSSLPIAAPSANISGLPSTTTSEHVIKDLTGKVDAILCGPDCEIGVESTVVKITDDSIRILRPGAVTPEDFIKHGIKVSVSEAVTKEFSGKAESPGMKYKHYSPSCDVIIIDGEEDKAVEYIDSQSSDVSIGVICYDENRKLISKFNTLSLGSKSDDLSHAKNLFSHLRLFDKKGVDMIFVMMPGKDNVDLAVYNRLIRAAAFKIIKL